MSTLADRLRAILTPSGAGDPALRGVDPPEIVASGQVARGDLEQALGGRWSGGGRGFVVERRLAADALHGHARMQTLAAQMARAGDEARLLVSGGAARPPFVFFDLETTGLGYGAGTYAFLVGCGWFDDDGGFVVRQHLLTDVGEEPSMLAAVSAEFGRAGTLVSFNGKSFDAPMLEGRYLFHRLDWDAARLPHLDVLHPARRFWGHRPLERCSLTALEQQILGARRVDDVPGFEIPARYFQFVRTGDARPLASVFEHNRLDLLSLAGLTARLLHLVVEGPEGARDAREALALGRVYERGGLDRRARAAFEHAADHAADADADVAPVAVESLRALALMLRRMRQYEEAAACWRRLLEVPSCPLSAEREASEALAIHHEHRVRDFGAARSFALRSLDDRAQPAWNEAVRHRLQRIERKMTSGRSLFPSSPSRPSCGSPTSGRRTSS